MHINIEFFSDEDDSYPLVISGGSFDDFASLINLLKDSYNVAINELKKRKLSR